MRGFSEKHPWTAVHPWASFPYRTKALTLFTVHTLRSTLYALCLSILLSGCSNQEQRTKSQESPAERTWLTMGTFASLTLRSDNAKLMPQYLSATKTCFEEINQKLSTYIPTSEISKINSSTGTTEISQITAEMLQTTLHYSEISSGTFDPTIAPLIKMWGFSGGKPPTNLPTPQTIAKTLKQTGYENIELGVKPEYQYPTSNTQHPTSNSRTKHQESNSSFIVHRSSFSLDLGGIAKGFAVDRAYDILLQLPPSQQPSDQQPESSSSFIVQRSAFSPNLLINLGGNIRCHGNATPNRPWCIGVRHPFDATETVGSLIMKSGMAIATSGNYERFVTINNKRYAHVIDPRTGYPVQGMAGVTILSNTATEADAISTALFVAGIEGAPAILSKLQTSEAILIPDKTPIEIWITSGLQDLFTPHPKYANSIHLLKP